MLKSWIGLIVERYLTPLPTHEPRGVELGKFAPHHLFIQLGAVSNLNCGESDVFIKDEETECLETCA